MPTSSTHGQQRTFPRTDPTGRGHARAGSHRANKGHSGPHGRLRVASSLRFLLVAIFAYASMRCGAVAHVPEACNRLAYGSSDGYSRRVPPVEHPPVGMQEFGAAALGSPSPGIAWCVGSRRIRPRTLTAYHHGCGGGGGGRGGAEEGGTGRGPLRRQTVADSNVIANVLAAVHSADGWTSGCTAHERSALAEVRFAAPDERIDRYGKLEDVEIRIRQMVVAQVLNGRVWPRGQEGRGKGRPWRSLSSARTKVNGGNVRAPCTLTKRAIGGGRKAACVCTDFTFCFSTPGYAYGSKGSRRVGRDGGDGDGDHGSDGSGMSEGRGTGGEAGEITAQGTTATFTHAHIIMQSCHSLSHDHCHHRSRTPHRSHTCHHAHDIRDPVLVVVGVRVVTSWADRPGNTGRRAWGGGSRGV